MIDRRAFLEGSLFTLDAAQFEWCGVRFASEVMAYYTKEWLIAK